jgi:hypothetical protein
MNNLFALLCGAVIASSYAGAEPIDIPAGVFVALPNPQGGFGISSESKHVTWAYNPIDHRLYSMGGDFDSGDSMPQSYRQDQYSLSIAARWANRSDPNAGWKREYPYCGPNGGIQPKSPDFVAWTWDSNRSVFWNLPGTFVIPGSASCPDVTVSTTDDAKYKYRHIMTYDPFEPDLTKRWTDHGLDATGYRGEAWMAVHDPVRDRLIRFSWNQIVDFYDIGSGTWTQSNVGSNGVGHTTRVYDDMLSTDYVGRKIYVVDGTEGRLMRWDMDRDRMDDLGPVPDGPVTPEGNGYSVWDSINRVVIFFHMNTRRLHVYHPDTQSWETPSVPVDPSGASPYVRHAMVFDPSNNVTAFLGNTDASNRFIYLYRYKEGTAQNDPKPSAPTGLTVQ